MKKMISFLNMGGIVLDYTIAELWHSSVVMPRWQSVLLALGLFFMDSMICWANWYCQQGAIMEYGYPRVKIKKLKKTIRDDSVIERIFMVRLCRAAKKKGFLIWLCWIVNLINVLVFAAAIVGMIGVMITSVAGWAMLLLLLLPISWLLVGAALRFIPDLLFLPSERNRYKWK